MAEFESYDQRVADGLVRAHEKGEGLPGYLGIRLTETWPGGMRAEIPVRDCTEACSPRCATTCSVPSATR
jgi:hypothetical protein